MIYYPVHKNTMIIIKYPKKINTINQNIYSSVINSLDFSSIHCPKCNESGLKVHAYYYRTFKKNSIRITRLICPHCRSTHALLLSPMIPFISSVSYDDMMSIILHKNTEAEIDDSLTSYFFAKFVNCFRDYCHICLFNSRNLFLSFITTCHLFISPPLSSILES